MIDTYRECIDCGKIGPQDHPDGQPDYTEHPAAPDLWICEDCFVLWSVREDEKSYDDFLAQMGAQMQADADAYFGMKRRDAMERALDPHAFWAWEAGEVD